MIGAPRERRAPWSAIPPAGSASPRWAWADELHAEGPQGGRWTFAFDDGTMAIREELDPAAELTVTLPAGAWAAVLPGKRKIETAVLQGKLPLDGKPETALPPRKPFGL